MGIIKRIRQAIRKRKASDFGALVAPAYDPLTRRTSTWAHSWNLQDVALYRRGDARHQEALTLITRTQSQANLFFFVGHGSPSGLFTDPQIGKVPSPISNRYHGCLLDTDDLVDSIRRFADLRKRRSKTSSAPLIPPRGGKFSEQGERGVEGIRT